MKRLAVLTILALAAMPAMADGPRPDPSDWNHTRPPPAPGFRYPDCYCTDSQGKRIELGQTTCLQIGSQQVLAQCSMSLNNPTWRRLEEGCPIT